MRMSDDIASRPQMRISVTKRRQNSGSTSGATASRATTMPKPIQYDGEGPERGDMSLRRGHEEAGGSEEQREHEHDERHDHGLGRAHEERRVRLEQADEDRREDGAAEVAHAAHHHHHEGAQGEVEPDRLRNPDEGGE